MKGFVYNNRSGVIWADGYFSENKYTSFTSARGSPSRSSTIISGTEGHILEFGKALADFLPNHQVTHRNDPPCNLIEIVLSRRPQFPANMLPLYLENKALQVADKGQYRLYFLHYSEISNDVIKHSFDSVIKKLGFVVRKPKEYYDNSRFELMMKSTAKNINKEWVLLTTDEVSNLLKNMDVKVNTLYIRKHRFGGESAFSQS